MTHPIVSEGRSRLVDNLIGGTLDKCSRWAERRVYMPAHGGRPARWYSFEDFPWVREILDSRATWNWVRKGAQVGLTVAGMVRAFHELDYYGRDCMYLLPTDKAAQLFSKTRLRKVIELSPYLKNRVEDALEVKMVGLSCLYIRGANGDINVKSTPVSRLFLDEVDEMEERQIWLALERLSGEKNKVVWGITTPKFPGCGIDKLYAKSTQEHFFFGCPHCKSEIELTWPDAFELRGDSLEDPACKQSYLKCPKCLDKLDHETKTAWLSEGYWKATSDEADEDTRGFWLPQLYSTTVSPGEIAIHWHRGMGDEDARREFWNSKLGLPYVEDGAQVTRAHISGCVRKYSTAGEITKIVPGRDIITIGIDQGQPHHFVAVKWDTSSDTKYGDTNDRAVGRVIGFGRILQDDWAQVWQLMYMYRALHCVIDYYPDPTNPRHMARKFKGYVTLCQYVVGRNARELSVGEDDFGANVVKCDKVSWLAKTLGRVMSGRIEFPLDITDEFVRQLQCPIRVTTLGVDGNKQLAYEKSGPHDHYAHALNYAEIALRLLDPDLGGNDAIDAI